MVHSAGGSVKAASVMRQGGDSPPHRGGRRRKVEVSTGIKKEGGEEGRKLGERQEEKKEEEVQKGSVVGQSVCHTDHQVCLTNIVRHIRTTEGKKTSTNSIHNHLHFSPVNPRNPSSCLGQGEGE